MIQEIHTALHSAYLDPVMGEGLLVMPLSGSDMDDPAGPRELTLLIDGAPVAAKAIPETLYGADFVAMMRRLVELKFEPTEGEDGEEFYVAGVSESGRTIFGLCGLEPIVEEPDLKDMATASVALMELARRL